MGSFTASSTGCSVPLLSAMEGSPELGGFREGPVSLPEEAVRWHLGELGAWEANSFHVDWETLRQARGFPGFSVVKNLPAVQEAWFSPWVGKIPCRREWQSTPVCLPREFHGQRSLMGRSPWGHKESDTAERLINTQRQGSWAGQHMGRDQPESLLAPALPALPLSIPTFCIITSPGTFFPSISSARVYASSERGPCLN